MTTDPANTFAVVIADTDAELVAAALEQRADARLKAARTGAGELAAEEANGTVKDARTGALSIYRMLAEADRLTAVADRIGQAQAAAQAAGWPLPILGGLELEVLPTAELDNARRRIEQLEAELEESKAGRARLSAMVAELSSDRERPEDHAEPTNPDRGPATFADVAALAPAKLLAYAEDHPDELEQIVAAEEAGRARKAPLARLADLLEQRDRLVVATDPDIAARVAAELGVEPDDDAAALAAYNAGAAARALETLDALDPDTGEPVPDELTEELDDLEDTDPVDVDDALEVLGAVVDVTTLSDDELEAIIAGDTGATTDTGRGDLEPTLVPTRLILAAEDELAARQAQP